MSKEMKVVQPEALDKVVANVMEVFNDEVKKAMKKDRNFQTELSEVQGDRASFELHRRLAACATGLAVLFAFASTGAFITADSQMEATSMDNLTGIFFTLASVFGIGTVALNALLNRVKIKAQRLVETYMTKGVNKKLKTGGQALIEQLQSLGFEVVKTS